MSRINTRQTKAKSKEKLLEHRELDNGRAMAASIFPNPLRDVTRSTSDIGAFDCSGS